VGSLWDSLDDPAFAQVIYAAARSAAGAVLRGTGIRVQTVVVAGRQWGMDTRQIATEFGLTEAQVKEAVAFYGAHQARSTRPCAEQALEASHDPPKLHLSADASLRALHKALLAVATT